MYYVLAMLPSKGPFRNFKTVLTVFCSYLGGRDVTKHFNPVPKLWFFFEDTLFFFVLKVLDADEAACLGPFLE